MKTIRLIRIREFKKGKVNIINIATTSLKHTDILKYTSWNVESVHVKDYLKFPYCECGEVFLHTEYVFFGKKARAVIGEYMPFCPYCKDSISINSFRKEAGYIE